jgi:two-component system alkaline phosphatase synthesis response regulator PhoP
MAKETILVVEDDDDIRELVRVNLERDGFRVIGFSRGEDALRQVQQARPACVVLDLMLPGMDGLEVCRRLRSATDTVALPIVMLTAKGEEADIVAGLELGADEYIVKPFSPRVLVARLKAVLRRPRRGPAAAAGEVLAAHELSINPGRHEVLVDGAPVALTASEFRALYHLAARPGWVFTRAQIIEAVHGSGYPVTDRSVDVLMVELRRKLGQAARHIETVRGIGYRFKEDPA